MPVYARPPRDDAFRLSRRLAEELIGWLSEAESGALTHAELEEQLTVRGRQWQRQLLQDHFDLRAVREERLAAVTGHDAVVRVYAEPEHQRMLATVFGPVAVTRMAYRAKGSDGRFVADAELNLPEERYSHGLRRLAACAAAAGSFEHAQTVIASVTGMTVGKRQVQQLVTVAAVDVDAFYAWRECDGCPDGDVLVLTADAKGIVMRPQALRKQAAAKATSTKLSTRLSKGEKHGRKRMAEVVAVYHCTPALPRLSL